MVRPTKLLKNIWLGKTDPQRRLNAWIWRQTTPLDPPSDAPLVVFAIPLISRRRAPDWSRVEANLAATLGSIVQQTNPNWIALVCGQNRPEGLPDDDRIQFLTSTVGDKFYDKGDKRRQLLAHTARHIRRDGYYFQCDADDILHPKLVDHICTDNNGAGYYIDQGYFVDAGTGRCATLGPDRRPFHLSCGSSTAARFDFRRHRRFEKLLKTHRSHTKIVKIMRLYGFPMTPVPFRAGLYMVNHGQNMIERRGKLDARLGYLDEAEVTDPTELAGIEETFGVALQALV